MIGQVFSTLGQTTLSLMATGALHVATVLTGTTSAVPTEPDRIDLVSEPDDGVVTISPNQVRTGLTVRGRAFAENSRTIFSSVLSQRTLPKQGDLGSALAFGLLFAIGVGAIVALVRSGRREGQDSAPIVVEKKRDVVATGKVLSVDTLGDLRILRDKFRRGQLSADELERVLTFLMHGRGTRQQEALDFLFEVIEGVSVGQRFQDRAFRGLSEFLTRFPSRSSQVYIKLQYLVFDHPERFGHLVVQFLEGLLNARYPVRTVQARASLAVLAVHAESGIAQSAHRVLNRFGEAEEAEVDAGLDRMTGELEIIGRED